MSGSTEDNECSIEHSKDKICCPECKSQRVWKDGKRYNGTEEVQRYLCRVCGYRFSKLEVKFDVISQDCKLLQSSSNLTEKMVCNRDVAVEKSLDSFSLLVSEDISSQDSKPSCITTVGKDLNAFLSNSALSQVGVKKPKLMKNLVQEENDLTKVAGATTQSGEVKGKIVEFAFWMQKQNYSAETIRLNTSILRVLSERGANILDTEDVKKVISMQPWSDNRRRNAICAYSLFLKLNGRQWEKPKCKVTPKIPFIPTENEIDALISSSGKKLSTFLLLLKETAMRCGEAKRLLWTDVDFERSIIVLNAPEKNSNPRMWRVSQELIVMLRNLPKEKSRKVFGEASIYSMISMHLHARQRLAEKMQNPRFHRISFHTFRHWKATMEYHKTKDVFHVKNFLGHKSVKNTEIYINIENTLFEPSRDEFTVRVVEKAEEVKGLLEVGFEYICQKDNLIFLRKRK
jgi:integrase